MTALAILHTFTAWLAVVVVLLILFGRVRRGSENVARQDDAAEHVAVTIGTLLGVLVILLAAVAGVLDLSLRLS